VHAADGARVDHVVTDEEAVAGCPECGVLSTSIRQRRTTRPRAPPYGENPCSCAGTRSSTPAGRPRRSSAARRQTTMLRRRGSRQLEYLLSPPREITTTSSGHGMNRARPPVEAMSLLSRPGAVARRCCLGGAGRRGGHCHHGTELLDPWCSGPGRRCRGNGVAGAPPPSVLGPRPRQQGSGGLDAGLHHGLLHDCQGPWGSAQWRP
jgi:hypothetical protein